MTGTDVIGWFSSFVLIATIAKQIHKQWKTHSSEGVSKWLFIGQLTASIGFTIYSALVHNWVFVVTNTLMLCNAIIGFGVVMHHKRQHAGSEGKGQPGRHPPPSGSQRALVS